MNNNRGGRVNLLCGFFLALWIEMNKKNNNWFDQFMFKFIWKSANHEFRNNFKLINNLKVVTKCFFISQSFHFNPLTRFTSLRCYSSSKSHEMANRILITWASRWNFCHNFFINSMSTLSHGARIFYFNLSRFFSLLS